MTDGPSTGMGSTLFSNWKVRSCLGERFLTSLKLPREGVAEFESSDQLIVLKMYLRRSHPSGSASSGAAPNIGVS